MSKGKNVYTYSAWPHSMELTVHIYRQSLLEAFCTLLTCKMTEIIV